MRGARSCRSPPLWGRWPAGQRGASSHTQRSEASRMTSRYPAIAARYPEALRRARRRARRRAGHPAGRPVPRHGWRGSAPPHFPHRERDRADAVPQAGIHHPRLPRSHRQPRRHAAPLCLSRRGVSPAPRGRQRVLPGRHRGSWRDRHRRGRCALGRRCGGAVRAGVAGPGAGDHARRPGGVRGGAGRARPAARLAEAAGAGLWRAGPFGLGAGRPGTPGCRRRGRRGSPIWRRWRSGDACRADRDRPWRRPASRPAAAARRTRSRGGCWRRPSSAACTCRTTRSPR